MQSSCIPCKAAAYLKALLRAWKEARRTPHSLAGRLYVPAIVACWKGVNTKYVLQRSNEVPRLQVLFSATVDAAGSTRSPSTPHAHPSHAPAPFPLRALLPCRCYQLTTWTSLTCPLALWRASPCSSGWATQTMLLLRVSCTVLHPVCVAQRLHWPGTITVQ